MIYSTPNYVIGYTAINGKVPESGNLRDFLTIEELDKVQELESKIAGFIEVSDTDGKNGKEIYQMVKKWIDGGAS